MYKIVFTKTANKKLNRLSASIQERIAAKIDELANNPRPHGSKKLTNKSGHRIRIGDYRVIYEIEDKVLVVLVIDVDHRKQVYD